MLSTFRSPVVGLIAFGLGALVCFLCVSRNVFSASQFLASDDRPPEPVLINGENDRGLHIDSLDLGVIESGGKRTALTWLRNSGADSVVLKRLVTSCDCLSVEINDSDLAPGETVPVRIDFDDSKDPGFTGRLSVEVDSIASHGERTSLGTINLEICADARIRNLLVPSAFNTTSSAEKPF